MSKLIRRTVRKGGGAALLIALQIISIALAGLLIPWGNGPQPVNDYLTETYAMATSFHATQHLIAQQLIRVDGDEAVMWSYGIAHHKRAPGDQLNEIIAGVQYRDKCKRYPQGWLITERSVFMQWMDMAPPRTPPP